MARGKASSKIEITVQERQIKVLDLRRSSHTYREIGQELDISHTQARADYQAAMDDLKGLENESAEEMRLMEVQRLDALLKAVWKKAMRGDLFAVDRAIKLGESKRKLLGLDKPAQLNITTELTGPSWAVLQGVVMAALAPFPEARAALAERLMELNPIEGEVVEGDGNAQH